MVKIVFLKMLLRKIFVSIIMIFLFISLMSDYAFSDYRIESENQNIYEEESDGVGFGDRFDMYFDVGVGNYYGNIAFYRLFGLNNDIKKYVDRLGLKYSENIMTFNIATSYVLTNNVILFLGIPFGWIDVLKDKNYTISEVFDSLEFDLEDSQVAIGDVYGGLMLNIYGHPEISFTFGVKSNTSEYFSLGDGLWGYSFSAKIKQLLSKSYYIYGDGQYMFRSKENGISPGDISKYGGGFGFTDGQSGGAEIGLKVSNFRQTKIDDIILFDDADDLSFNLDIHWGDGWRLSWVLGNLEDFEFDDSYFSVTIPIM